MMWDLENQDIEDNCCPETTDNRLLTQFSYLDLIPVVRG